uniref:Chemosensory protein n=1 Tax=Leucinodes orbonalis TaxID=711050 RepID=A0AAU0QJW3_9NEOP|nr:chemosensory protein [Leucinodes orbonalis]
MWSLLTAIILRFILIQAETTAPGIDRTLSEGVTSKGFRIVYGDEDMTIINEVVGEMEKNNVLKPKVKLNEAIKPLPATDVKCLMSADKYCTKEMRQTKGVLIQALKDDCQKCSTDEKDHAGKIVASMMAHDPVAWKLFLTRYDALNKAQRILG